MGRGIRHEQAQVLEMVRPAKKTSDFHAGFVLFFKGNGDFKLEDEPSSLPGGYEFGIELDEADGYVVEMPIGTRFVAWPGEGE